jgi:hypothetical protein
MSSLNIHRESRSSRINRALAENDRRLNQCLHRSDNRRASRMVNISATHSRVSCIFCCSERC